MASFSTVFILLFYATALTLSVSGILLRIQGVDSCNQLDKFGTKQACNYTYNDETLNEKSTMLLVCFLCGKTGEKGTYWITCADSRKELTFDQKCQRVSYEIPLTMENETVTCTAMRADGNGSKYTADIQFHYFPSPPTAIDTETTEAASPESPATPSTLQLSTDDVTQGLQIPSCPTISWPFWLMTGLAAVLFVALVVLVLKCRNAAKALEATRNDLRQIEEQVNESAVMAQRSAMAAPPELLYDSVYAHGAGLLRRPQK